MPENQSPNPIQPEPDQYEIRVKGHLAPRWHRRFEQATITLEENGVTVITALVADQAALYGLLKRVRDTGMHLLSVTRMDQTDELLKPD